MNEIFFPSQYKMALLTGTKNTTIRIGSERGKYVVGKTYKAKSYAGKDVGVQVTILKIIRTTLKDLEKFGIPKRSIEAIRKKENCALDEKVDLIRFSIE